MAASLNRIDVNSRLEAAVEALQTERRRTADELEALKTFERHIRAISSEEPNISNRQPVALTTTETGHSAGLRQVRKAYESTLMDVPHYFEEYDDTYPESLAEEFSPDIASALTNGTAFNKQCKQTVLSAISESQSSREALLDVTDRERESIRNARAELEPLFEECDQMRSLQFDKEAFGALDAYRARLQVILDNCQALSHRRQKAIFDSRRIQKLPADVPDITIYFYQTLDTDYPVMSLVAELLETITDCERRIERAMATCHA